MKALITVSVASMVDHFLLPSIHLLQDLGYEVVVATNFDNCGNIPEERCEELKKYLTDHHVIYQQVDFPRSPFKLIQLFKSFYQVGNLLKNNSFDLCHCHSPTGGIVTRIAGLKYRNSGLSVIYTAHGFHFYKGAPIKNWLIYYPLEKVCSYFTDVLITINKEDYALAQKKMKAKMVTYVPGVGIDIKKYANISVDQKAKRAEIGVPEDAFLILSAGELNENKNHQVILRAIENIKNHNIYYVIVGKGDLKDEIEKLARELGIEDRVCLLGYRNDLAELYKTADAYVLPSIREGLNVSLMEAMASELPCIVSNIRGNTDLIEPMNGGYLCKSDDEQAFALAITSLQEAKNKTNKSDFHKTIMQQIGVENVMNRMKEIYQSIT